MTSKSTGFRVFSFSAVTVIVALVVLGGMASLSSASSGNPTTFISGISNTGTGGALADTFALLAIMLSIAGAGSALYLLKPEQETA